MSPSEPEVPECVRCKNLLGRRRVVQNVLRGYGDVSYCEECVEHLKSLPIYPPSIGLKPRFWRRIADFQEKCQEIFAQRGNEYNRDADVREYAIFGILSFYQQVWGKAKRLKSIIGKREYIDDEDLQAFRDSCFDLANYAAMLYAENECRREDNVAQRHATLKERIDEHAEVSNGTSAGETGSRNIPPTPGHVGHVVVCKRPGAPDIRIQIPDGYGVELPRYPDAR